MITFFAPLWNKERTQNAGSAAVDYNVSNITGMVYDEKNADEGFTFITLGNGDIIDATDEIVQELGLSQKGNGGTGVEVFYYNLKTSKIKQLADSVNTLTDTTQSVPFEFTNNNKSYVMTYSKLMNYNLWYGEKIVQDKFYIVSILPTDSITNTKNEVQNEITNLSNKTMLYTIILSIVFAMVSIVCTVLYAWRQTKQIRLISQGLKQIGDKNYDVSIDVISKDEIGNLAETFNKITSEVLKTHSQLESHAMDLEEKIKERTLHLEAANQKLEQLNRIDPLTKINNRRHFDTVLEQTWREYARLKHPISIIMVDIDYFKKYNDYYGHQDGDACLCLVASTLADQLNRSSDMIARYGGEEFVAIVCVGIDEAHNAAEKMRLAIKALAIEHKLSEKGIVTISLGVACVVPSADQDAMEFIKAADIALYKSKQAGRDIVSLSEWS